MNTLEDHLEELLHIVMVARANYTIWWIYKNERPKYIDVLNTYIEFFRVGIHANFVAMLMALYKLGDPRGDSVSVKTFLAEAKNEPSFSATVIASAELKLKKMNPIWQKVRTLRHKLFAHRDRNLNYDEVLKSVAITGNELRDLTEQFLELLNELLYYRNRTTWNFEDDTLVDTHKVLDSLKSQL